MASHNPKYAPVAAKIVEAIKVYRELLTSADQDFESAEQLASRVVKEEIGENAEAFFFRINAGKSPVIQLIIQVDGKVVFGKPLTKEATCPSTLKYLAGSLLNASVTKPEVQTEE